MLTIPQAERHVAPKSRRRKPEVDEHRVEVFTLPDGRPAFAMPDSRSIVVIHAKEDGGGLEYLK